MEDYELILMIFQDDLSAAKALEDLKAREEDGILRIFNAAVLSKDEDGRTVLHEDQDLSPGMGSAFGALVGGLIGLLAGPGGVIVGAAAGAATGGLVAGGTDLGFEDKFLKDVKTALKPGSSVLLLLIERRFGDVVAGTLLKREGQVLRHVVKQDVINRLNSPLDE